MSSPLGKGLESLIPERRSLSPEIASLDVLDGQARLVEPVYRFHDGVSSSAEARVAARSAVSGASAPAPESVRARRSESVFWIDVGKIEPNPQQPRRDFNVDELTALADSIRAHGILTPLLVTKREIEIAGGLDVRYELIAGERRWRAAKIAGLREVPVTIRSAETPEREKLELALIENVQREDLNPMERARAFERLVVEFGMMQKEVAEQIGKSREVVANAMRLLRLPEAMQSAILANVISESHARILLTLEHDPAAQQGLFDEIRTASLSVRDAELSARAVGGPALEARRGRRGRPILDPDTRALQKQLEEAFGTKVKLLKRGDHGKIVVEFYSDEELRGILERIAKREEGYV